MAGNQVTLLDLSPSDQLIFAPDETKPNFQAVLKLSNRSVLPVAFKIKTTAPKNYTVQPNKGQVPANSSLEVTVSTTKSEAVDLSHKFQLIAVQTKAMMEVVPEDVWSAGYSQTNVLTAKVAPGTEFATLRSVSTTLNQSLPLEGLNEDQGLRQECEGLGKEVDDLKKKVQLMSTGINNRQSMQLKKADKKGFGNLHIFVCFIVGVFISFLLNFNASS